MVSLSTFLIRFSIVLAIILIIDLYVFQNIKIVFKNNAYKNYIYIAYWAMTAALLLLFVSNMVFIPRNKGVNSAWVRGAIGFAILLVIPKLLMFVFLISEDVIRILIGCVQYIGKVFQSNDTAHLELPGRRRFISQIALGVAAIPFAAIINGMISGRYNFKLKEVTLKFKNLPKSFDGLTITQISDIHIGSFSNAADIQKGIDVVKAANSDLVLFTGDLVNNIATEVTPWLSILQQIKAPLGVYSVFGNHDYGDYLKWDSEEEKTANLALLKQYQKEAGFDLLLNEHRVVTKNNESIAIVGVENWGLPPFPQHGDLNQAVNGLSADTFKILMSHDPSHWGAEAKNHESNISLALAGHTHGMQFGVDIPGWRWSPVKFKYPQWIDLYPEGDKFLYVNRGFGFLAFPGRVGVLPEITKFTLRCA